MSIALLESPTLEYIDEQHNFTLMFSLVGKLLNKDEIEHFIESKDPVSAVKSIAYKPIGLKLSRLISAGFTPKTIDNTITEYLIEQTRYIYSNTPHRYKTLLKIIEEPYDVLNIGVMYNVLRLGGSPTIIYPAGTIFSKGASIRDIRGLMSIIKEVGLVQKLGKHVEEEVDVNKLLAKCMESLHLRYMMLSDPVVKKVYGLIYDYVLIRCATSLGKNFIEELTVGTIYASKESLQALGKEDYRRAIEEAVRSIGVLGEIYNDIRLIARDLSALDYAHAFSAARACENSIMPSTFHPYLRALLLTRVEALLVKLGLLSLLGYIDREALKNVVYKWWFK